jgi:hypothetical protein
MHGTGIKINFISRLKAKKNCYTWMVRYEIDQQIFNNAVKP